MKDSEEFGMNAWTWIFLGIFLDGKFTFVRSSPEKERHMIKL